MSRTPEIFDKDGKALHIGAVITPFWLWLVREAKIEVIDADVSDSVLNEKIKTYIQNNLSVEISSETNDFMSTDGSTLTRFSVKLLLDGKEISSDSYYG
jgi:hypothetical protein